MEIRTQKMDSFFANSPCRTPVRGEWTAGTLKVVAMITMVIDHIGMTFFPTILYFRWIGRLGFPLFAYFIAEGFLHTHSKRNYSIRLFLLALISELPYVWLVQDSGRLDTVFTLWLGMMVLWTIESFPEARTSTAVFATIAACAVAELLRMDYGTAGILAIVFVYIFRKKYRAIGMELSWGALVILNLFSFEWLGGYAYLLVEHHYRGKRGNLPGSLWYWFYPLHLILLHLIYVAYF